MSGFCFSSVIGGRSILKCGISHFIFFNNLLISIFSRIVTTDKRTNVLKSKVEVNLVVERKIITETTVKVKTLLKSIITNTVSNWCHAVNSTNQSLTQILKTNHTTAIKAQKSQIVNALFCRIKDLCIRNIEQYTDAICSAKRITKGLFLPSHLRRASISFSTFLMFGPGTSNLRVSHITARGCGFFTYNSLVQW